MIDESNTERIAGELAKEFSLPPGDAEQIAAQARSILVSIARLDEMPLESTEPAAVYRVVSDPDASRRRSS
jgi:hypothetical protein